MPEVDIVQYILPARVAGAVYCLGPMPGSFFFGKASRFMLTGFIDGLIFAAVTAGVLAALWP
ncbi:MAG: hypothetical protein P8M22_00520 [Phycisphaerales bacterium]|nr:hypothetical protein [Phycisphaerales bacterium]